MNSNLSRRALMSASAAAFTIIKPELVRGAGKEKLRAGLVGCGGRGTQATLNLLSGDPNVEIVAMADVFEDKLEGSLARLRNPKYIAGGVRQVAEVTGQNAEELAKSVSERVKVEPDKRFASFDAFKKLAATDVDIVMLCTPPGYRPEHFEAAINAKKHVFTEKPIATDPVGVRRFLAAVKKAQEMKLTVVSGAQRHADAEYVPTVEKIKSGAIGDIVALNSRYLSGPVMHAKARDPKWGDMEWQHRNWYSFLWICGDQIVEQHYHNIDFMNWVMGAHPVSVVASGGVAWRPKEELYGNIYDHIASDFVYPNGVRLSSVCRQYPQGTFRRVDDLVVGTKGRSNGQDLGSKGLNPYVQEHINLVKSIRGDGPYLNEGQAVAEATLTCIMGREAAYSGVEVTWDMAMNSKQDLQPKAFDYKLSLEAPPVPVPGVYKFT
jgi:predicted dehydrogenase